MGQGIKYKTLKEVRECVDTLLLTSIEKLKVEGWVDERGGKRFFQGTIEELRSEMILSHQLTGCTGFSRIDILSCLTYGFIRPAMSVFQESQHDKYEKLLVEKDKQISEMRKVIEIAAEFKICENARHWLNNNPN